MRPNTKSSTPHTINDVVDEPVDGIVPLVLPLVLPPVLTFEFPPVTGVDAPTITKLIDQGFTKHHHRRRHP